MYMKFLASAAQSYSQYHYVNSKRIQFIVNIHKELYHIVAGLFLFCLNHQILYYNSLSIKVVQSF